MSEPQFEKERFESEKPILENEFANLGLLSFNSDEIQQSRILIPMIQALLSQPDLRTSILPSIMDYPQFSSQDIMLALLMSRQIYFDEVLNITNKFYGVHVIAEVASQSEVVEKMISSILHELAQPLTTVSVYLDIVAEIINFPDMSSDDKIEVLKYLKETRNGVQTMTGIFRTLRVAYLSRNPQYVNMDLPKFLENVIESYTISNRRTNNPTKVILELPEKHEQIQSVDRDVLGVILKNLISNALKAVANVEDSEIKISYDSDGSNYHISVSDNGVGINAEDISKIFDYKFTKLSINPTEANSLALSFGSGVGLHITHSLIINLNGKIEVESEVGKGSIFKVTLPKVGFEEELSQQIIGE